MNHYLVNHEKAGLLTGVGSLIASFIAGLACVGPMLGILLGIGGLGWLSRYSYLTMPASIASLVLLAGAIYFARRRKCCPASKRKHRLNQFTLATITLLVVAINVFEFLILPNLV